MADKIVSWGGIDSKGTTGMGVTGSLSVTSSNLPLVVTSNLGTKVFVAKYSSVLSEYQNTPNLLVLTSSYNGVWNAYSPQVGIGLENPAYNLDVYQGGPFGGVINLESAYAQDSYYRVKSYYGTVTIDNQGTFTATSANGGGGSFYANVDKLVNLKSILYVTGSSVGIGTTAQTSRLTVKGTGATSSTTALLVQNSNASASFTVRDDRSATFARELYIDGDSGDGTGSIYLKNSAGDYSNRIGTSGYNTFISTRGTANGIQLQFGIGSGRALNFSGGDPGNITITSAGASFGLNGVNSIYHGSDQLSIESRNYNGGEGVIITRGRSTNLTDPIVTFKYETAEKVRINNSGNVGIGISNPTASLHISGALSSVLLQLSSPTSSNILYVTGSGNVLIGTNTPVASTIAPLYIYKGPSNGTVGRAGITLHSGVSGNNGSYLHLYNYVSHWASGIQHYSAGGGGIQKMRFYIGYDASEQLGDGGNVMTISYNGLGINTLAAEISANLQVKGSGTTSSTTALLVQNANASASFAVKDDGTAVVTGTDIPGIFTVGWGKSNTVTLGSNTANCPQIYLGSLSLTAHPGGSTLSIDPGYLTTTNQGANTNRPITVAPTVTGTSTGNIILLSSGARISANRHVPTSGVLNMVAIGDAPANQYMDFAPSSGNATFNSLYIRQQINTSGSYAGIVRGIFYEPLLTSITGVTHRAIETATGDVIFGSISGKVGIGTSTPSASLHISGSSNSTLLEIDSPAVNNILYVSGSGNIGIGTSTPNYKLDVNGTINTGIGYGNFTTYSPDAQFGAAYVGEEVKAAIVTARSNPATYAGVTIPGGSAALVFGTSYGYNVNFGNYIISVGDLNVRVNNTTQALYANTSGQIGIKYSGSLSANLQVRGSGTTSSTTALLVQNANATASLSVLDDGSVGIGTASPNTGGGLTVGNPAYTGGGRFYQAGNATTIISGGPAGENITFGPSNRIFLNAGQTRFPGGSVQMASTLTLGNINATGTNMLLMQGSITAGSALGRGIGMDTTLVAAANNDVLVGVDINPTFNNGGYTGVTNLTLRVSGSSRFTGELLMSGSTQNRSVKLTDSGLYFSRTSDGGYVSTITADGAVYFNTRNGYVFNSDGTTTIQFQSDTRNVLIGTTSDLARLTVRGSGATTSTRTLLLQNSSNTQLGYVDDSGRWQIGPGTNSGFALEVSGSTQITGASGGYKLTLKTTGGGNGAGLLVDQNGYTMFDVGTNDVYMRNFPSNTAKLDFWCWNNYGGPTNVLFAQNSQYHVSLNSPDNYKIPIVKFPDATVPIIMGNIATSAIRAYLTVGGAFYASASLGASQRIVSTVSAIANNDTLVGLDIQPTFANGAYTGVNNYALRVSGSTSLYKSGSTVLDIQGSSGQLFSVTDSLSGSLFSVNTVAGLPVIEAFSNNVVNIGKYGSYGLVVSGSAVTVATGSSAPTGTAAEGTFKFAVVGGSYYIYVYLGGAWRSGSLS